MVTVSVNDEFRDFAKPVSLEVVLQEYRERNPNAAFAVAINGEFLPRARYGTVILNDGDAIDIVSPVGGG